MINWITDDLNSILQILFKGIIIYLLLIFILRISGKRTLSKMNAFDFIVTIALGSVLATIVLNNDTSLTEGFTALAVLIFLQYLITWSSVRFSKLRDLVKSEPTLIFYEGNFLKENMKRERILEEEVFYAIRSSGKGDLDKVKAVVLETDGTLSVLESKGKAMENLKKEKTIK